MEKTNAVGKSVESVSVVSYIRQTFTFQHTVSNERCECSHRPHEHDKGLYECNACLCSEYRSLTKSSFHV